MTQQTFRGHHNQRLSPSTQNLPPQAVKQLRRRGRLHNLKIVVRRQFKESFESRAGMFRALAFQAVRKQERNAAQPAPLVFCRGDELIDDNLRRIPEIAELSFPRDKSIGRIEAVAVLKSENACFREWAVVNIDRSLVGRQILKWLVDSSIFHIVQ